VEKTQTGESFEDDADILISARGNLNDISWPKIPGLDSFQGEVMHSAAWNQKLVERILWVESLLTSIDMTSRTRMWAL
jgi:cation diffusion facilitator CzcD-associated flavoprotein CzcO